MTWSFNPPKGNKSISTPIGAQRRKHDPPSPATPPTRILSTPTAKREEKTNLTKRAPTTNDQAGAALGLTKEETKEHLQITSKQGGETHTEAGDEDEMTVPDATIAAGR
jgi:hypothetical protein